MSILKKRRKQKNKARKKTIQKEARISYVRYQELRRDTNNKCRKKTREALKKIIKKMNRNRLLRKQDKEFYSAVKRL